MDHLALLEGEVLAMAAAFGTTDPEQPVASCPDWRVRDLAAHLIGIHRWARAALDSDVPPPYGEPAVTGDLAQAYEVAASDLLEGLRQRSADAPAWTFDKGNRTAGFWRRRQLHEVGMHRWDLQPYRMDDAVAADGVDEVVSFFVPRLVGGGRTVLPEGTLHLAATERSWAIGTGTPGVHLSGSPEDLLLAVWGRGVPLPGPWAGVPLTP